jgi:hypothetical protein
MNLRCCLAAVLLLAAARAGLATPREMVTFTAVPSDGVLNDPANAVRSANFAGGYALGRIDFSGTLTSVQPRTWRTDSRILVTAPSGATATIQPFTTGTTFTTVPFSGSLYTAVGVDPVGTWSFRFYEAFDDGNPGDVDALCTITITLTDEPPAPPAATSLGTILSPGRTVAPFTVGIGQFRWYSFVLDRPIRADIGGRYLDIDTAGSSLPVPPGNFADDTMIGLYDASGNLLVSDDDSGDGFTSMLTFGAGTRAPIGDGLPYNGRNGPLPAGTYYLAAGPYQMVFGPALWNVSVVGNQHGSIALNFRTNAGGSCPADLTHNGAINVQDFLLFLQLYAAADPRGDFNADGAINVTDFLAFLAAYAAGCP